MSKRQYIAVAIGLIAIAVTFQNCSSEDIAGFKFDNKLNESSTGDLTPLDGDPNVTPPTAISPTPSPTGIPPAPPVPAAAFRCRPAGVCFSNISSIVVRELELFNVTQANNVGNLNRIPCSLNVNPAAPAFATKEPGYPVEWVCQFGPPRVDNPNLTGFRSNHLNSPFRASARADSFVITPFNGGDGEVLVPPQNVMKGDLVFYFNNESMLPATIVQDAIAEANSKNNLRIQSNGRTYDYRFTTTCAADQVLYGTTPVRVLRCVYSAPVLQFTPPVNGE